MTTQQQVAGQTGRAVPEAGLQQIGELIVANRVARALTAAVELGVFDALAAGHDQSATVAAAINGDERRTEILLDALASAGLVHKQAGRYTNTATGQRYLVLDSPDSLVSNLRYQEKLAKAWAALPEVVRTGRPHCGLIDLLQEDPAFTDHYIRGMAEIAKPSARDLVRQLDLSNCKTALDVGGGPGSYAAALAAGNTDMQVHLLDLAPTLKLAAELLADSPVADRVVLREGNYLEASYGTSEYDLVLLSHVTHDEGDAENVSMLERAYEALRPGGVVVVHDFMLDADGIRPKFDAMFSLHLTVYTQKGKTYSAEEYGSWMKQVGFQGLQRLAVCDGRPNATQALIGIKR